MRYFKVDLGGFEPWMYVDEGELHERTRRWTQPPQHWAVYFLEHDGIMTVNNRPLEFQTGNIAFVPPGTKAEFSRVGSGTRFIRFTFEVRARSETVAIAAISDLGDRVGIRREECRAAVGLLQFSIMPSLAFCFNLLWSIAQPAGAHRKSDLLADAETLILKRLSGRIDIGTLADELAISHSHLLRLFREEHGCTIQEFVRDQRVQLARQLIVETDIEIKEVAVRAGMPDLQHFNKVIRLGTGLSPRALRQQADTRARH